MSLIKQGGFAAPRRHRLRQCAAGTALVALVLPAPLLPARLLRSTSTMATHGVVAQPCSLAAASVPRSDALAARQALRNPGPASLTHSSFVPTSRPPRVVKATDSYDDVTAKPSTVTLVPGRGYVLQTMHRYTAVNPMGARSCYHTYQTTIGLQHASQRTAHVTVLAASPTLATDLLPGQQIWEHGVSSYLFGTVDTIRWSAHNIGNDPAIWRALRRGHFTLLRTWFFKTIYGVPQTVTNMANRLRVIAESGMACLGVLPQWKDAVFNASIVAHLGRRCNIYEFGNEPDIGDWGSTEHGLQPPDSTLAQYLQQWNAQIPALRRLNPAAKFVGPACATVNPCMASFLKGVQRSGVRPDGLTFHLYACGDTDLTAQCVSKAHAYVDAVRQVRSLSLSILGVDLPIGITEWNYNGSPHLRRMGTPGQRAFVTAAITAMIHAHVAFATQFDAANGGCGGACDLFDTGHNDAPTGEYYALTNMIHRFMPRGHVQGSRRFALHPSKDRRIVTAGK